ncbi:MAG: MATE family efflux transporter [Acidobacteriota bacterium]
MSVSAQAASPSEEGLRRRFLRLTLLNALAGVTVPLTGLVDAAILGHLDAIHHLAGVALGAVVFDYVFWTFGFLRMATTGLAAQAVGREDPVELQRILLRSASLALAAGAAILLLRGALGDLAFGLLSGDVATEASGRAYYDARVLGAPAALANFVFLGWFLGREESRIALMVTVVGNVTNIVLDVLFIREFGWEARGAGLATMAAQYLMLAISLAYYLPRRAGIAAAWRRTFHTDGWRALFGLQGDIMVRTLLLVSTFSLFTDFSARLGTQILAANALLLKLVTLAAFLIDGAAIAVESLAGIFWGAGQVERLRRLLHLALGFGVVFALAFTSLTTLFPEAVLGLLTKHDEVIQLGIAYRLWLVPVLLLGSIAYVYDGLFLGLTAGRQLRNAMLFSAAAGFLPLALLALHQRETHLLWAALATFMLARCLTLGWASGRLIGAR